MTSSSPDSFSGATVTLEPESEAEIPIVEPGHIINVCCQAAEAEDLQANALTVILEQTRETDLPTCRASLSVESYKALLQESNPLSPTFHTTETALVGCRSEEKETLESFVIVDHHLVKSEKETKIPEVGAAPQTPEDKQLIVISSNEEVIPTQETLTSLTNDSDLQHLIEEFKTKDKPDLKREGLSPNPRSALAPAEETDQDPCRGEENEKLTVRPEGTEKETPQGENQDWDPQEGPPLKKRRLLVAKAELPVRFLSQGICPRQFWADPYFVGCPLFENLHASLDAADEDSDENADKNEDEDEEESSGEDDDQEQESEGDDENNDQKSPRKELCYGLVNRLTVGLVCIVAATLGLFSLSFSQTD